MDGKISSLSRANREGHKEPFTPFLKMEWGEIPQRVKLYCERTDSTRKLDGRASYFREKLHFTTVFTFKKGKLKVKFTLLEIYFQSKIQFQDKNIHKPIFPPLPQFPHKKKGADIRSQRSSHLTHIKKKRSQALLFLIKTKKSHSRHRTSTASNSSHYNLYGKSRSP